MKYLALQYPQHCYEKVVQRAERCRKMMRHVYRTVSLAQFRGGAVLQERASLTYRTAGIQQRLGLWVVRLSSFEMVEYSRHRAYRHYQGGRGLMWVWRPREAPVKLWRKQCVLLLRVPESNGARRHDFQQGKADLRLAILTLLSLEFLVSVVN